MRHTRGRFEVDFELMRDVPNARVMMKDMVVFHIETNLMMGTSLYWGDHPQFDEIEEGTVPPMYTAVVRLESNQYTVTWVKVDG